MKAFNELSQLIFPSRCIGCSALSQSICPTCTDQWKLGHFTTKLTNFSVHSAVSYTPVAATIILAAKENGIAQADELLIQAIISLLEKATINKNGFRLVPIPSGKKAQRRRGRSFIVELTNTISRRTGIATLDCLALTGNVIDQSGLSRRERVENMKGAFMLLRPARGELILIDDVITTGATLKAAARALNSHNSHAQITAITACVAHPLP